MPSSDATVRAQRRRVLIVGGGFGGLYAARALKRADADVTLLDRSTSNLFQPLLYQCATGLLSEGEIASPLRVLLRRHRNVRVLLGEATDLNPGARTITASRPDATTFTIGYDYLILAAGMRQSYFGNEALVRYAPGMKTLDDALTIRRRIYSAFETAETLETAEERTPWLTFAVVGAGPTGVELAGQIRDLATRTLAGEFHTIDPAQVRVVLFDGGDAPVVSFGPGLVGHATRTLEKLGVEMHFGVHVTDVTETGLTAEHSGGTSHFYEARTTLWTAGVEAVPFVRAAGHALSADVDKSGRISVHDDLSVPGHPNVYVVGDIMSLQNLPGLAEVAMQGGRYAGKQIAAELHGKADNHKPFHYRNLGTAAYVARYHALVEVGPVKLAGFVGWILWGLIHLSFLAGVRNRGAALSSWLLTLGRDRRRERAFTYRDPDAAAYPYPDSSRA